MNSENKEKLKSMQARVPIDVHKRFMETKPKGVIVQHVMTAALRLWSEIPEDYRISLILAESNGTSGRSNESFTSLVEEISQNTIKEMLPDLAAQVKKEIISGEVKSIVGKAAQVAQEAQQQNQGKHGSTGAA